MDGTRGPKIVFLWSTENGINKTTITSTVVSTVTRDGTEVDNPQTLAPEGAN